MFSWMRRPRSRSGAQSGHRSPTSHKRSNERWSTRGRCTPTPTDRRQVDLYPLRASRASVTGGSGQDSNGRLRIRPRSRRPRFGGVREGSSAHAGETSASYLQPNASTRDVTRVGSPRDKRQVRSCDDAHHSSLAGMYMHPITAPGLTPGSRFPFFPLPFRSYSCHFLSFLL